MRRDDDLAAVRPVGEALQDVEADLGLVRPVELELLGQEAQLGADLGDRPHRGGLGDLEAAGHRHRARWLLAWAFDSRSRRRRRRRRSGAGARPARCSSSWSMARRTRPATSRRPYVAWLPARAQPASSRLRRRSTVSARRAAKTARAARGSDPGADVPAARCGATRVARRVRQLVEACVPDLDLDRDQVPDDVGGRPLARGRLRCPACAAAARRPGNVASRSTSALRDRVHQALAAVAAVRLPR